eukprot:353876-Chlamydomonas_euryale.AAC.2
MLYVETRASAIHGCVHVGTGQRLLRAQHVSPRHGQLRGRPAGKEGRKMDLQVAAARFKS